MSAAAPPGRGAVQRLDQPYVLVTAARDEAHNIVRTIESVLSQTAPPARWIIVDDGSVDQTFELAQLASAGQPAVAVVQRSAGSAADFASKVLAIRVGAAALSDVDHALIGILDADVSMGSTYFEQLHRIRQILPRPKGTR